MDANSKQYLGVNWILQRRRVVSVAMFRRGEIGRYVVLAAHLGRRAALVFHASGCLASLRKRRACPSHTSGPAVGSPVPVAAPQGPGSTASPTQPGSSSVTITVSMEGHGAGTVSGPTGLACPGNCAAQVAPGTRISLTATAATGSMFVGWTNGCSATSTPSTSTCTEAVQTDQTLSAIFNVLGDLNGDGYVDCADQAILQAHYGQPGTLLEGDLNGDGTINILDLSILESHLRQPPGEGTCPAG